MQVHIILLYVVHVPIILHIVNDQNKSLHCLKKLIKLQILRETYTLMLRQNRIATKEVTCCISYQEILILYNSITAIYYYNTYVHKQPHSSDGYILDFKSPFGVFCCRLAAKLAWFVIFTSGAIQWHLCDLPTCASNKATFKFEDTQQSPPSVVLAMLPSIHG